MILVTAAHGNQGQLLVPKLLDAGQPVRARVRTHAPAARLRARGAPAVVGPGVHDPSAGELHAAPETPARVRAPCRGHLRAGGSGPFRSRNTILITGAGLPWVRAGPGGRSAAQQGAQGQPQDRRGLGDIEAEFVTQPRPGRPRAGRVQGVQDPEALAFAVPGELGPKTRPSSASLSSTSAARWRRSSADCSWRPCADLAYGARVSRSCTRPWMKRSSRSPSGASGARRAARTARSAPRPARPFRRGRPRGRGTGCRPCGSPHLHARRSARHLVPARRCRAGRCRPGLSRCGSGPRAAAGRPRAARPRTGPGQALRAPVRF